MNATKTQTRGICQCCGREQAVLASGRMSKHGYTVDHGWFSGVCSGQHYEPLQVSRKQTDVIIAQVRAGVVALLQRAADLSAARLIPETVRGAYVRTQADPRKWDYEQILWADARPAQRTNEVARLVWEANARAKTGTDFADGLGKLADRVHGSALRVVELEAGPAPIACGERRQGANGEVLVAKYAEAGRVYWTSDRNGQTFASWTGTQAWRKLPVAA